MKMKKVKEVCKRIGVGLLSAALLLTGGSFSQVRSAKAEETESFNLGHFPMNIMVLVPKEVADLSAESKELLSTGAFNRSGQVGGGAVIDVENVTPLENYDNKYNGYKVKLFGTGCRNKEWFLSGI